jgi:tetratricopeptide (TPR) repeat protein
MPAPRKRARALLAALPLFAAGFFLLLGTDAAQRALPAAKAAPKSLEEWRALRKTADEAMSAPRGPQRIEKCEALLREHPTYRDPRLYRVLVDDLIGTRRFDPARVAQILERWVEPEEDSYLPVFLVSQFYFRNHLPLDSAERLLKRAREALAREQAALKKETDPKAREQTLYFDPRFQIELDEGRILLARRDAAGAVKKLREAEAIARDLGEIMTLRDSRREIVHELSSQSNDVDWLYVSLSEAYARLGERSSARQCLAKVKGFGGGDFRELAPNVEKLRRELKVAPPARAETRTEPMPAKDFTLDDLEGKPVSLSDYRGRVVLVMLWTTW